MEMQMEALTTKRNNPEMIALWTQRIAECKNSGISSQEWCEQNGIHIKTYYYWHNKIHKMVNKQQSCFYETPMHDLRHTFAVISLQNGDDFKTLQENLGHSSATTTLNVYAHVSEKMKEESARRQQAYIESRAL